MIFFFFLSCNPRKFCLCADCQTSGHGPTCTCANCRPDIHQLSPHIINTNTEQHKCVVSLTKSTAMYSPVVRHQTVQRNNSVKPPSIYSTQNDIPSHSIKVFMDICFMY
jgi:hypothetical protein